MPAAPRHRWTMAEVDRLIDARPGLIPRYELVDGELLVTTAPTWRHQRLVLQLAFALRPYLTGEGIGEILLGPGELPLVPGEHFGPDLFVVPAVRGRRPPADAASVRPLLVCEVLSPSSSRHDRITKRRAFQHAGVAEYWIVDGDAEAFEIWHPGDERAALNDARIVWQPEGAATAFELDVATFFAAVADNSPLP